MNKKLPALKLKGFRLTAARRVFAALALVVPVVGLASHLDQSACAAMQANADQGSVDAQYSLGMMYKAGQGCPQDIVMSFFWLDLSARAGYAPAFASSDEVSELLTPQTIFQIGKAEDQWLTCQRVHSPCDPTHQLQMDSFMESLNHL